MDERSRQGLVDARRMRVSEAEEEQEGEGMKEKEEEKEEEKEWRRRRRGLEDMNSFLNARWGGGRLGPCWLEA